MKFNYLILFSLLFLFTSCQKYNYAEDMKEFVYNDKLYKYSCSKEIWVIYNSCEIKSKKDINKILTEISENNELPSGRTIKDMVSEWAAHNLLYNLHLFRTHTNTVDLEKNQSKILKFLYKILSLFYK
ncbi:MAG: hypothetical protein J1F35_03235 [Erysipelotrichales bacterium]|nr:hypothetical protein [Erysipelotrichales bacterium]